MFLNVAMFCTLLGGRLEIIANLIIGHKMTRHFYQSNQKSRLYLSTVKISNSNWTEWSRIQGIITRVISKLDERKARGRFEITSTITPFIKSILKSLVILAI